MERGNCIEYSCERALKEAVYLEIRRSSKGRLWPHVLTVGPTGLHSYSPGSPNPHPAEVLVSGYDGTVWEWDNADPKPWRSKELLIASWLFALGVTFWWIKKKLWRNK